MNQIIIFNDYKKNNTNFSTNKKKKSTFFKVVFIISILLILISIYFLINYFRILNINYQYSESLADTVRIQALYKDLNINNNEHPIIGQIEIPKINLNYPIFSYTSDDLLKIGICRLYGPSPNSKGNLCLAGHNYNNNKFFSNLYKLNLNDIITIFDSSNISVNYKVSDVFEVTANNLSILKQDNNLRELTLITCNNINKNRIIIKAKEIE